MARLPEGALMQRAAHGLATAVVDLLGSAYGRRVLLLVGLGRQRRRRAVRRGACWRAAGAHVEAWLLRRARARGRAGGAARGPAGGSSPSPARRPDVVVDGIVGIGGRPGLQAEAAQAALKLLHGVPVVAVDTPSGSTSTPARCAGASHVEAALTVTFGTHKVCHLVDPAAEACGAVHLVDLGLDLPAAGGRGAPARGRRGAAAAARRGQPEVHPRRRRRPRRQRGVPRRRPALASPARPAGCAGMVRYVGDEAVADGSARRTPRSSAPAGCRPGWSAPAAASGAGDELREPRSRTASRCVVDADALQHVTGGRVPAVLTPHAGELAAMLDVDRADDRGPAAALRPARPPSDVRRGGAAQGPPHAGRPPRRPGPRQHHRHRRGWPRPAPATCSAA